MGKKRIKEIVKRLKMLYNGLSLEDILIERNIVILPLDDCNCKNQNKTKGVYKRVNGIQIIYIHPELCDFEKKMVLAHELGHSILHHDVDFSDLKKIDEVTLAKYEIEADVFVAEFLLDDDLLDIYPEASINDIACREYVYEKFIWIKLDNLGIQLYNNIICDFCI